jgi:hypothetical protein
MNVSKVKEFNIIFKSFLKQIIPRIGKIYYFKYKLLVKCNSLMPIEQFIINVLPLREKIMNRDESYFVNNDNHKDHINNDQELLNEVLRLQDIYFTLDDESKSNIWNILQALLVLSDEHLLLNKEKYKINNI